MSAFRASVRNPPNHVLPSLDSKSNFAHDIFEFRACNLHYLSPETHFLMGLSHVNMWNLPWYAKVRERPGCH